MERLGLHNFQQLAQQKCVCVWEVCLEQPFGTCTIQRIWSPQLSSLRRSVLVFLRHGRDNGRKYIERYSTRNELEGEGSTRLVIK